jgi:hypothetical protein
LVLHLSAWHFYKNKSIYGRQANLDELLYSGNDPTLCKRFWLSNYSVHFISHDGGATWNGYGDCFFWGGSAISWAPVLFVALRQASLSEKKKMMGGFRRDNCCGNI